MNELFRDRTTVIWVFLVAATCVSWWLGTSHGGISANVAGVAIFVVAFIKLRYVGLDFMELRGAPVPLRVIFEVYVLVVGGLVIGMFLFA